jgi:hypothetical protein
MTFLAALVFLTAGRYLTLNPDVYFPEQKAVYMLNTTALLMHIVGAMLAVILGPFQFLPRIRSSRFLNVPRWLGRTYLTALIGTRNTRTSRWVLEEDGKHCPLHG